MPRSYFKLAENGTTARTAILVLLFCVKFAFL